MKALLILFASALVALGQDSAAFQALLGQQYGASGGVSYLLKENFETPTTGYDNSGWTQGGTATITPNSTVTVLQGTQSLLIDCTGGKYGYTYYNLSAAQPTLWVFFRFQSASAGAGNHLLNLYLSGTTTEIFQLTYLASGALRIYDEGAAHNATTVATVSAGTTYLCWVRYTAGSGANAVLSVGFSTGTIEPTSGNNFASITTGASTANAGSVALFTDSVNVVYDTIRLSVSDPGNNPL